MKNFSFVISFLLLIITNSIAQTYTMSNGVNGTFTTCSGTFVDNGGSGSNYSANQNSTITFCPSTPGDVIRVSFSSFDTQGGGGTCNDMLDVWYANAVGAAGTNDDRFCGTLGAFTVTSVSPDGCISFQFISDNNQHRAGWEAAISCVTPCTNPIAGLTDYSTVDICPSTSLNPGSSTVAFDGSPSTSSAGTTILSYNWEWGDGTTSTTTTAATTHTYSTTGVYVVKLFVRDNNTDIDPLGCISTNSTTRIVRVLPPPSFAGTTSSPISISCGQTINIDGIVTSQTATQATPSAVAGVVSLPDGSGVSYTSGIDYSGFFPAGSTVTSACYPTLTFELEHSWGSDLSIDLISPSGQEVRVFNRTGGSNKFGLCVNGADDGVPGCGALYTVVNSGGVVWPGQGVNASTTTATTPCGTFAGPCETGNYHRAITYNSASAFTALNGADLNGTWSLRVTDNVGLDDGTLFSWSLSFPTPCYNTLESVTPDMITAAWSHSGTGPTIPTQSTISTTVTDPGPGICPTAGTCTGTQLTNSISVGPFTTGGSYDYIFTGTDEFGCQYQDTVTVDVTGLTTPVPSANNPCEGATLNLTTATVAGATYSWTGPNGFTSTDQNPTISNVTLAEGGTYEVTINVNGCISSPGSITAVVNSGPAAPTGDYNNPVCSGQTLNLSATPTVAGATYNWSGPNGFASTDQNPTITNISSAGAGAYYVTYTSSGCTSAPDTVNVSITPLDNASFAYSSGTYCQSGTTTPVISGLAGGTFSATPAGLNFNTSTGEIDLSLSSAGSYSITYQTNGTCPSNSTETISITTAPSADFSYSGPYCLDEANPLPTFPAGSSAGTFSSTSGLVFVDVNTGEIDLASSTTGIYTVTNTISVSGCPPASYTAQVELKEVPVSPVVSYNNPVCEGQTLTITADSLNGTSGATYTWTGPNGFTSTQSNNSFTNATIALNGTYTVTASLSGCTSNTVSLPVIVNENPTVTITPAPAEVCMGSNLSLLATIGSGSGSYTHSWAGNSSMLSDTAITNPVFNSPAQGTYNYNYTVTDGNNCSFTEPVTVTVFEMPTITMTPNPAQVCQGDALQLEAVITGGTSVFNHSWTGDISELSAVNISNPVFTSSVANIYSYSYTVTDANNCAATATMSVTVNEKPTITITPNPAEVCAGDNLNLLATITGGTAGFTHNWTGDISPLSDTQINNPSFTTSTSGTYNLNYTITDANTCTETASLIVTVNDNPTVSITPSPASVCEGDYLQLTAGVSGGTGTINYVWTGDISWLDNSAISNPVFNSSVSGIYNLNIEVNDQNGCGSTEAITVTINPPDNSSFSYAQSVYCSSGLESPNVMPTSSGGFTAPAGLTIDPVTGEIDLTSSTAGTYLIEYTSTGQCPTTSSFQITLGTLSTPTASTSGTYCDSAIVTAAGSGGTFAWYSDPSLTTQVGMGNSYNVLTTGEYFVVETLNGCTSLADSVDIIIQTTPPTPTPPSSASYCQGDAIAPLTVTGTGGTINWYDNSALTTPIATGTSYAPTTSSTITYYITETNGVCSSPADSVTITINPTPVAPIASLSGTYCDNAIVTATGSSGTFAWYSDPSLTTQVGMGNNYNVLTTGEYFVVETLNGCTSLADSVDIIIQTTPPTPTPPSSASYCQGDAIAPLTVTGTGGTVNWYDNSALTTPIATGTSYAPTTSSTITYYITETNGICSSPADSVTITIYPTPAAPTLTSNSPACVGENINLISGVTGGTVNWTSPTGASIPGNNPILTNVTIADTGTYSATLTQNGCTSTASSIVVSVNPKPAAPTVQAINAQCEGTNLQLNADPINNGTYNWTGPNGFASNDQNPLISNISTQNAGTYYLTVTVNGCESDAAQTTATIDYANALFSATPVTGITPLDVSFINNSTFANNYVWQLGTGATSTEKDTVYTYTEAGNYEVTLVAFSSLANCPDTFSITILVESDSYVEIPNVFSPNGDGKNDLFKVINRGLKTYNCSIFNRWGTLVFKTEDPDLGWNGKLSGGKDCSEGTYFITVKAEGEDGKSFEHTGTVTLVR